jgi:hypothetical protein
MLGEKIQSNKIDQDRDRNFEIGFKFIFQKFIAICWFKFL